MTPSYTPVIPKLCMYLINAELTIVSSLKHKNTQPIYIFKRENPQNSEPQNGPRRGLDFIALSYPKKRHLSSDIIFFQIDFISDFFFALQHFLNLCNQNGRKSSKCTYLSSRLVGLV